VNKGKFCAECGKPKPASEPLYKCDKCGWEPAGFGSGLGCPQLAQNFPVFVVPQAQVQPFSGAACVGAAAGAACCGAACAAC